MPMSTPFQLPGTIRDAQEDRPRPGVLVYQVSQIPSSCWCALCLRHRTVAGRGLARRAGRLLDQADERPSSLRGDRTVKRRDDDLLAAIGSQNERIRTVETPEIIRRELVRDRGCLDHGAIFKPLVDVLTGCLPAKKQMAEVGQVERRLLAVGELRHQLVDLL